MHPPRMLFIVLFLLLCATHLNAEKLYMWTDGYGVLNITNHPSFAPAHLKTADEDIPQPQTAPVSAPPAAMRVMTPAPATPQLAAEQALSNVEQTIQNIEDRNTAIKKLQELIEKLLPFGASPKAQEESLKKE